MSKPIAEVLPDNLLDHRAVQAWNLLGAECAKPESIEILKRNPKSAVYRLRGLSPAGPALVAKRCYTRTAEVERIIYERLLPRVGLPALRCYGFLREPAGNCSWLFLEDAAGLEYSSLCDAHRLLAGNWLGALDGAALEYGQLSGLPGRDCDYYLNELRLVRAHLQQLLSNPIVPAEDLPVLRAVASQCAVIEAHWVELQDHCSAFPRTIVHGDFVVKNVRVRSGPAGDALLVFDWEVAGWGVPATDLAQLIGRTVSPNLAAYRNALARHGVAPPMSVVQQTAQCGRFFRMLDSMLWACQWGRDDSYVYLSKAISCFRSYADRLERLLPAMGWSD